MVKQVERIKIRISRNQRSNMMRVSKILLREISKIRILKM